MLRSAFFCLSQDGCVMQGEGHMGRSVSQSKKKRDAHASDFTMVLCTSFLDIFLLFHLFVDLMLPSG